MLSVPRAWVHVRLREWGAPELQWEGPGPWAGQWVGTVWHDGVASPGSASCLCDDSPSVQDRWASEVVGRAQKGLEPWFLSVSALRGLALWPLWCRPGWAPVSLSCEMGCSSGPSPLPPGATPAHSSCPHRIACPRSKRGRTPQGDSVRGAKTAGKLSLAGSPLLLPISPKK